MKKSAKAISIGILRALAVVAGIAILLWLLFKVKALILYFGLAMVVSLLGRPIMVFLKRRLRFGNVLAAITTLIIIIAVISTMISIFVPVVIDHGKHFTEIDFEQVKRDVNELNIQASDYLGIEFHVLDAISQSPYIKDFNISMVAGFIQVLFGSIGNIMVGLFSVLFISFFLLKDEHLFGSTVIAMARRGDEDKFRRILIKIKELLSRYFVGILMQILILALFYSVLLLYLGMPDAIAIALICAFFNIVPYLGPLMGYIFMLLVIISNNLAADFSTQLLPLLLIASGGYGAAQLFDNVITQPLIFGRSVRSHPLEIFIVILAAGFIYGIPGMILAVPGYTTIKVIAKEFFSEYKIVEQLTRKL